MQTKNRRDFDAVAEQWDQEPRRLKLAQDVVAALRKVLPLTRAMEVLDYGCGSGLVTLGLHPFIGRITGADSSRGMLDVLDKKIQAQGLDNVSTMLLDLEKHGLEGSFDLIVSSMTLHHVQDVPSLIASLSMALKPGGWLALADLATEDGRFHDDPTGVLHHGFSGEFLSGEFARNALVDVSVVTAAAVDKKGADGAIRSYPVLLCCGHK
ncbi:class I SAM-dependent methyltransferase [Geomonas sp. Red69]|uniref:Class I SAM-dependent methyltransferase n=1 Tax=Geomonas diazotrophica TaxID=2843197 RepID=A0ABX8JS20_9BACT|nr:MULTISPECIES: class I SAM-dependent methyltransferase [Geomonas]MBU5635552.1 class I SAM-dependent methyltransferase [Geomonas diazotrophica]QWV98205.1 class I SAM-dependent methyltransferase [Geomonas nitrogeniifigens]QXE87334.1 class I SAM-dependent methyltransferase [Geomonas nitrogeniifigens]